MKARRRVLAVLITGTEVEAPLEVPFWSVTVLRFDRGQGGRGISLSLEEALGYAEDAACLDLTPFLDADPENLEL